MYRADHPASLHRILQVICLLLLTSWAAGCQADTGNPIALTDQDYQSTPTRTPFRPLVPTEMSRILDATVENEAIPLSMGIEDLHQPDATPAASATRASYSQKDYSDQISSPAALTPTQPVVTVEVKPTQIMPLSPVEPTSVASSPTIEPTADLTPFASSLQSFAASPPSLEPSLDFYGIDFNAKQRVEIKITPPDSQMNKGKPIKISFIPGNNCRFGTRRGCVYAYKPTYSGNVLFITVHSGVGGEAQRWRSVLEGTGVNRAGYTLEQTLANLRNLENARVEIRQGERQVNSAQLGPIVRIPATALDKYFDTQLADILAFTTQIDAGMEQWIFPDRPIIVLETCGWKMPGEEGSERISDTTGSIYLAVIR